MLRETARKSCPENVDSPMVAPRDYEVRQSGLVLELQDKDLWIRPTDLSWHYPILLTTRELPFTNYRGRSIAILEARDKPKKQKTHKKSGIKHTGKRLGSHNPIGSEVFFIDFLGKATMTTKVTSVCD